MYTTGYSVHNRTGTRWEWEQTVKEVDNKLWRTVPIIACSQELVHHVQSFQYLESTLCSVSSVPDITSHATIINSRTLLSRWRKCRDMLKLCSKVFILEFLAAIINFLVLLVPCISCCSRMTVQYRVVRWWPNTSHCILNSLVRAWWPRLTESLPTVSCM